MIPATSRDHTTSVSAILGAYASGQWLYVPFLCPLLPTLARLAPSLAWCRSRLLTGAPSLALYDDCHISHH